MQHKKTEEKEMKRERESNKERIISSKGIILSHTVTPAKYTAIIIYWDYAKQHKRTEEEERKI